MILSIMKDWGMPRSFSSIASAAKISAQIHAGGFFLLLLASRCHSPLTPLSYHQVFVFQNSTRRRTRAVSLLGKTMVSFPTVTVTSPLASSKPANVPANSFRPFLA